MPPKDKRKLTEMAARARTGRWSVVRAADVRRQALSDIAATWMHYIDTEVIPRLRAYSVYKVRWLGNIPVEIPGVDDAEWTRILGSPLQHGCSRSLKRYMSVYVDFHLRKLAYDGKPYKALKEKIGTESFSMRRGHHHRRPVPLPAGIQIQTMDQARHALALDLLSDFLDPACEWWRSHAGAITWPRCAFFRHPCLNLGSPLVSNNEILSHIREKHTQDFGRETAPELSDRVWTPEIHCAVIEPLRSLVSFKDYFAFSIQVLLYLAPAEKDPMGNRGDVKGYHSDPGAYEIIVGENLRGSAMLKLSPGDGQPEQFISVYEGQLYVMSGAAVDSRQHAIECHEDVKRVALVVRFISTSFLNQIIGEVVATKGANQERQRLARGCNIGTKKKQYS